MQLIQWVRWGALCNESESEFTYRQYKKKRDKRMLGLGAGRYKIVEFSS